MQNIGISAGVAQYKQEFVFLLSQETDLQVTIAFKECLQLGQ